MTKDIFGMSSDEGQEVDEAPLNQVIIHMTPAEGWKVVFNDPEKGLPTRILGVAGFAVVETFDSEQNRLVRGIRPMVVDEIGQVDDVETFEDFVCLVPPGVDIQSTIDFVLRRESEQE